MANMITFKIDFPEFLMLMNGPEENGENDDSEISRKERIRKEREEELCDTFRMFDIDKSGYISAEELSRILIQFSGLSQDQVNIVLREADIDRDGEVKHNKCTIVSCS